MIDSLKSGLRNPELFAMEGLRITHRLLGNSRCQVASEDWDNLIILDGCRLDLFKETCDFDGELQTRISAGSCTPEWLGENFDEEYPDTVYVSANPQTQIHGVEDCFHESIRIWNDCWDEELSTAVPSKVADRAAEIASEFPHKRILVHFVQPHYPFIGEQGQTIHHRGFDEDARRGKPVHETDEQTVWDRLEAGDVDKETVWSAYKENLELTLPHVERLADGLKGKTVVSSDHGNGLGEWGIYGHPCGHYHPTLVDVPWFIPPFDERKQMQDGELQDPEETDELAKERLEDLGYVQ